MVWDRGEYEEISDNPVAAFYAGKLHLRMQGTKLKGEWLLLKDREQEASEKWLLIKVGKATRMFSKNEQDRSVLSGRSMSQIAQANDAQWQSNRGAASANFKSETSQHGEAATKNESRDSEKGLLCRTRCGRKAKVKLGLTRSFGRDALRRVLVGNEPIVTRKTPHEFAASSR
jgi:hypothetical protein